MLATIGYEKSSLEDFVATLLLGEIEVLVDIRERAQSRRPGFSKTALSQALSGVGIEYLHVRELGDPKEGRDAARAGKMDEFRSIFSSVLESEAAREALSGVSELAEQKRICLMCYERDYRFCHRKMVSDCLQKRLDSKVMHLGVVENASISSETGRVCHRRQSPTASV